MREPMWSDRQVSTALRAYLEHWVRGTLDDLGELYEEIEAADQTSFPWQPAIIALSAIDTRRLWRALDDDELQDLYDRASSAGLRTAAARFAEACRTRPYVDDGRIPEEIRALVMQRDGCRCRGCGSDEDLTIDHMFVPWVDGGSSKDPENLQVLCRSCNSRKGTRPWPLDAPVS